jgi:hypothetical protein
MGLSVEDEFRCPKSGYSIEMRVHDMWVNAEGSSGAAAGWAVEFDGPSFFDVHVASWWDLDEAAAS